MDRKISVVMTRMGAFALIVTSPVSRLYEEREKRCRGEMGRFLFSLLLIVVVTKVRGVEGGYEDEGSFRVEEFEGVNDRAP